MNDFSNLPKSWQIKTLGECLDYEQPTKYIVKSTKYDDSYKTPVLTAGKSFILGYTNESDGIFTQTPVIIFDDFTTDTKFVDFDFKVKSSAMKILHPKENIDIKFVYYLMQTIQYRSDTHKRYWISQYAKIKIPIPPLEIQRRIVKRLDEAFSRIESGTKHLKSAKDNLAKYKQSLLKSAFNGTLTQDCPLSQGESTAESSLRENPQGFSWQSTHSLSLGESTHLTHPLAPSAREGEQESSHALKSPLPCGGDLGVGSTRNDDKVSPSLAEGARGWVNAHNGESANLPQGWTIKTLGEVCEKISAGGDRPNDCTAEKTQENQIPIFSNGIENNGLYGYTKTPTITKPALTISARGTIGFVCVRYEPFFPIVRLICAIPNDKVLVLEFLAYALRYLIPQGEGSSIPQLTIPNFKQIKIPIPPLEIQKQIVAILEKHFTSADKVSAYIDSCLSKAKQLKSSLLKSAFTGELT